MSSGDTVVGKIIGAASLILFGTGVRAAVTLLMTGIGLSPDAPTGCAADPARGLGRRVAHTFLPIPNRGTSDWAYAWVPVAGPPTGGVLAGPATTQPSEPEPKG
ncbi:hypothetical protein ACFC00_34425 [Streptomyces adustus]|uniref:hypothetical protein n=1 Tax=Streptomyces adustus TaxID=1609272 RepID=UPI0035D7D04F